MSTSKSRQRHVVVIAGPTASGKSALALGLARRVIGRSRAVIVNADSMQVYSDLRIITARPSRIEEAEVLHRLYGELPASRRCSAAAWADMALAEIGLAHGNGQVPVVVGGTGLYLKALMEGLTPIPPIPAHIRQATVELYETLGPEGLHEQLSRWDPRAAARIAPGDSQRLMRAWEVMAATGRSITDWQEAERVGPPPDWRFTLIVLMPPRGPLYENCDRRFAEMMAVGALDEVAALRSMGLPPDLPAMKAVGVPPLLDHLAGLIGLETAVTRAQTETRRYAKRQLTWLRHQLPAEGEGQVERALVSHAQYSESLLADFENKVRFDD